MNKRRLLKLADLLEADAANKKGVKFDLGTWAKPSDQIYFRSPDSIATVDCNTTACAMGLACISGAFKRAGLSYEMDTSFSGSGFVLEPSFKGELGFEAAALLFSISDDETYFLFDADQYPASKRRGASGERFVAKRIRDFVAGKVAA